MTIFWFRSADRRRLWTLAVCRQWALASQAFNCAEHLWMGGGLTDLVPCRLSKEPDGNRSIPHCRWEKSSELERGGNSEVFFGV